MYHIIYFGEKPVYLCDEIDADINEILHHPDAVYVDEISNQALKSLLHEIKKPDFHAGVLFHTDLEELRKHFWKLFTVIKAAGGFVTNEKGELLMIFRKGHWDLPKGKLDDGESLEECALREVKEETGLESLKPGKALGITYHTYDEFGKHILKESHWYKMKGSSKDRLTPQTEEEISEIGWKTKTEVEKVLEKSYPSIREIIRKAGFISTSAS